MVNAALTYSVSIILVVLNVFCSAPKQDKSEAKHQTNSPDPIQEILLKIPAQLQKVVKEPTKYELQIIYTQINRTKTNIEFKKYTFHVDSTSYFYPASLVKLPVAALSLEKLNQLKIDGLNMNSCMQTDSAYSCQKKIHTDTTSENKLPSVANYIKRMLLISDNDGYSRLYEFLGQAHIYKRLQQMGYTNARIIHRFDSDCGGDANACTNPISFYNMNAECIYKQGLQKNLTQPVPPLGKIFKGHGYVDMKGKLVKQPKDYTYMNYLTLEQITSILQSILFPESVPENKRFNLTGEDRSFLKKYMGMYPRESDFPKYNMKDFEDSYKKYFIYGTWHKPILNDSIRIYNIVGQSYGYLSDCAYITNPKRGIEFMLSAVLYVNEDGIINDGKYEYKDIGFPFLAELGKAVYEYELSKRKLIHK